MPVTPTKEQVYERIYKGPKNPDNEWLSATAELLYNFPQCLGENLYWNPNGFLLYPLHLVLEKTDCKKTTVEAALDHILANHMGLLIFNASGSPLWELTHGQMLSWKLYGTPFPSRFFNAPPDENKSEQLVGNERVLVGPPNEQMLPPLVRDSIRWAMKERLKIGEPRAGVMSRESEPGMARVVFDLDPDVLGGEEASVEAYQLLTWYLPYCIPSVHMPGESGASYMVPL
jgi:hypothetical protein